MLLYCTILKIHWLEKRHPNFRNVKMQRECFSLTAPQTQLLLNSCCITHPPNWPSNPRDLLPQFPPILKLKGFNIISSRGFSRPCSISGLSLSGWPVPVPHRLVNIPQDTTGCKAFQFPPAHVVLHHQGCAEPWVPWMCRIIFWVKTWREDGEGKDINSGS